MKLKINNIAKIKDADLQFGGITIIVGDNNTGKTTIGRSLFSLFNSLVDIESKMLSLRERSCGTALRSVVDAIEDINVVGRIAELVRSFLGNPSDDASGLREYLLSVAPNQELKGSINAVIDDLTGVRALPDEQVRDRVVYNYFKMSFNGHYMPVPPVIGDSTIEAKIREGTVRISLTNNSAECTKNFGIRNHAYFIDSPDLLAMANGWMFRSSNYAGCGLGYTLIDAIRQHLDNFVAPEDSAIGDLLFEERIKKLCSRISTVIKGEVVYSREEGLRFVDKSTVRGGRFDLRNVSQGQKALGLILLALSTKVLNRKDVLILDEPEIHLHPEWEMFYAEMIVLLQKEFDLTILLTTHSPTFMRAVQLYALEHKLQKGVVNVYRTELDEDSRTIIKQGVGDVWDSAYLSFLTASYKLQDMAEKHDDELWAQDDVSGAERSVSDERD